MAGDAKSSPRLWRRKSGRCQLRMGPEPKSKEAGEVQGDVPAQSRIMGNVNRRFWNPLSLKQQPKGPTSW